MKENLKVSFVVPGYKCDQYIERNILSILDQDYRNYEIVVVLNGEWGTRKDLMNSLREKYGDKIQLHWIPEGGLGNANNFGFSRSTGDVIAHLSSDLFILPGTIRTWVEGLNENPECGFVYSGYKFSGGLETDVYYSHPFDRYHLECENFIDGANPVRREKCKPWDTLLRSLVDWDYFLSVTDDGTKGFYIKEPLYIAEPPKEGGLSDDSNTYWVQRRSQIQDKHHIPSRKICIASMFDQQYALELAKMVNADFRVYPGHKPHRYSLIYCYGFPCDLDSIKMSTGIFFQHYGNKIIHWVGSDIRTLLQLKAIDVFYYADNVLTKIRDHFVMNTNDQKILKRFGSDSEVIYPPLRITDDELKADKINGVSVNDADIYDQLKKAMPDIDFRINEPRCDISIHFEDRMDRTLRSICLGNHVISNHYIPGTHMITGFTNVPELRKMLVHTIRQIRRMNQPVDEADVKFYREKTNVGYFKSKLEKIAERKIVKTATLQEMGAREANA